MSWCTDPDQRICKKREMSSSNTGLSFAPPGDTGADVNQRKKPKPEPCHKERVLALYLFKLPGFELRRYDPCRQPPRFGELFCLAGRATVTCFPWPRGLVHPRECWMSGSPCLFLHLSMALSRPVKTIAFRLESCNHTPERSPEPNDLQKRLQLDNMKPKEHP